MRPVNIGPGGGGDHGRMTTRASMPTGSPSAPLVEALQRQLGATLIETHISWVLLDGTHAWKIKKPVRLPFLDMGELATRHRLCREELRLNRRLAPSLYLDVVAIRGTRRAPRIGGVGPAIEYALRMRQFPAGALLSEQLAAGTLMPMHIDRLARRLADFHADAAIAPHDTTYGSAAAVEGDTVRLLDGLSGPGDAAACATLRRSVAATAPRLRPVWQARRDAGRIREGHGDLHLANAVRLGDEVTAFDCLEFDPALRWIDVFSDTGFLVMDLIAHGRGDLGWRFLNAYLDHGGDHDGVAVLRWYLVYRALVRALVARIRSAQGGAAEGPDFLALALQLAGGGDARLMITHGVSGSGKSRLAQQLAEQAQALRLRSDVERKRLFGLGALDASGSPLAGGIYGADANRRTYARLREIAATALAAGERVIVDAAFLRRDERDGFHALAQDLGVPFTILHCQAPPEILRERVRARGVRGDDASEAGLAVLDRQGAWTEALSPAEQSQAIAVDTAASIDLPALVAKWRAER